MSYWEERRRKILETIIPRGNGYALDVGCGKDKLFQKILKENGYEPIGLDINLDVEPSVRADIRYLPFSGEVFNLTLVLEVLEHLARGAIGKCLMEIFRVSRYGGVLIISTPNRLSLEGLKGKLWQMISRKPWGAWNPLEHVTIMSAISFRKKIVKLFKLKKQIGFYYIPEFGRIKFHFLNFLRYMNYDSFPLNMLGFTTIIKAEKTPLLILEDYSTDTAQRAGLDS